MIQHIKDYLVSLGPDHVAVRLALALQVRRRGLRLSFGTETILLTHGNKRLILSKRQFNLVPFMLEKYHGFFEWIEAKPDGRCEVLDFSAPAFHRYRQFPAGFYFPGIPEEYSLDAYTHRYQPQSGDLVFDVGAHAGMTTYFLSQLVGETGRVIAFEPDDLSYGYLLRNIEHHQLKNVTPVKKAMSRSTGTAVFNMDGTMAAGLSEYLIYPDTGRQIAVNTISFADACDEFGIPKFAKIDIEGAEVEVVKATLPFLREHPVQLVFDSSHRLRDGSFTAKPLEDLMGSVGYQTESSTAFGELITWAGAPSFGAHGVLNPKAT